MEQYYEQAPERDYGSGVARPKIKEKVSFELKGQFLKELRENTFSGSDNEDANEHIKKVLEIVDLFHEVILFYNRLDVPTRQILDSRGRSTETSDGLAAIQAQLNNLGREIKKVNEKVFAAQVGYFIDLDIPEDIKVPLIFRRPFLSTARAKIDVYKRNSTLRVGEEKIIFKSVKPASSLIKRVYMLSLRERMELDLEARLMGETLVFNRSLDLFLEDYNELNDLNEPFELMRNQGDDLMPTIEECEVIKEFRTRDEYLDNGIDDYPSYCDDDKKIHIDCAHNLKFSCMIRFEFTHVNFFLLLYVNVMSKKFHNSIMKDKMVYKGDNVVGALMNVPIFVGTFSVVTDFAVLEDMDAYRDEGMGDVIVGEPFLREVGIKARRFDGMITIYNGNDEVTYQMVRSRPRFKHHTNEQCNKIPPLQKVSEHDKMNGISHSYQKLKRFYKGVLNLGPDFIRVPSMEEWLTRGHVSVHEME
ncbi:hypothetical protein Tco_0591287 [Tanacetum coccineum]